MSKPFYLLTFIFLLAGVAKSQEIKFGKVSNDELKEEKYNNDPEANAVVLYNKRETFYNSTNTTFELVTEIHERIKIYNKEGFEYATKSISLFKSRSSRERVRRLKAYTYNLEDGKVVKYELDKDQIFETEINYNHDEVKFTMPNVKEGSVIEFTYEVWSPFFWLVDEFVFQYEIPAKRVEAELRHPREWNFKQTSKGYIPINSSRNSKMDNRLGDIVDIRTFNLHNVPALKEEPLVDNINNYRSGIMFELVSFEYPGYFRSFARTWGEVASSIGSDEDYKNKLDKTNSFDDELDQVLSDASSLEDKMKLIFKYVKDNIKWNGYDGYYFYNGIRKTLKEKEGNAADLNLLLVAMLRYANLNANPVVISTKDNFVPLFPTVERLNYVVAYTIIGDKEYFLDATEKFSDINVMPVRNYNWRGLLIDNKNKQWKMVTIKDPETSVNIYSINAKLKVDGTIEGKFQSRLTNHAAYEFRDRFEKSSLDEYLTELEGDYNGIEISNYESENTELYEGPLSESFDFYFEDATSMSGDKIFIKPLMFLSQENNVFNSESRKYPIDFGYPRKAVIRASIMLPEEFVLESMPESAIYQLPENMGEFKFLCNANDKMVQLSVSFELRQAYISPTNYEYIKEFFNQVVIKESEQVVLTKS